MTRWVGKIARMEEIPYGTKPLDRIDKSRERLSLVVEWLLRSHKGKIPRTIGALTYLVKIGEDRSRRKVQAYLRYRARTCRSPTLEAELLQVVKDMDRKNEIWSATI